MVALEVRVVGVGEGLGEEPPFGHTCPWPITG